MNQIWGKTIMMLWITWTPYWHVDIYCPECTWSHLYQCSTLSGSQKMCRGAAPGKPVTALSMTGSTAGRSIKLYMVEMEKLDWINFIVSGCFKEQISKIATCTPQLWHNQSCLGAGHLDFWTLNCFHLYGKILVMENLTHYYMVKRNVKLEMMK